MGASYVKMLKRKAAIKKKKLPKKGEQRMVGEGKECTIVIQGANAKIEGTFPVDPIVDATSYFKPGHQFMQRFRTGQWDGRIRLFQRVRRVFPAGLAGDVMKALRDCGTKVQIDDQRHCPASTYTLAAGLLSEIHGLSFDYPYDFQPEAAEEAVQKKRGIIWVATNGGKTVIASLIFRMLNLPTLFMVPGRELLYQTHEVFEKRLGYKAGLIGDGHWEPDPILTVATVDTLFARLVDPECRAFMNSIDVVFADECHKVGSDSWYQVLKAIEAYYRYGMSGTPLNRTDGADLRLIGATGPIIYTLKNKELIERGISVQPRVKFLEMPAHKPKIAAKAEYLEAYEIGIVDNTWRNKALCMETAEAVDAGLNVLILVKEIKHGEIFDKKLGSFAKPGFMPHQFINGQEDMDTRRKALVEFRSGTIRVLISTKILDVGIDVPNIDVIVLAGGGKSTIELLQRMGRGLRKGGNSDELLIIDTIDWQNEYLLKHSLQRYEIYEAEECVEIESVEARV